VVYRVGQGLRALRPRIASDGLARAVAILVPAERDLFAVMDKRDQRHGIDVMIRLEGNGMADRDLLAAALLHDCGKGSVPVWLRTLNVLAPALVHLLARRGASGLAGAAFRLRHHAGLGAALAAAAGSTEATVRYIAGRVRPEEETKMVLLKAADDES
jgi:hypothetical protein